MALPEKNKHIKMRTVNAIVDMSFKLSGTKPTLFEDDIKIYTLFVLLFLYVNSNRGKSNTKNNGLRSLRRCDRN